jgi:hypothetical protein
VSRGPIVQYDAVARGVGESRSIETKDVGTRSRCGLVGIRRDGTAQGRAGRRRRVSGCRLLALCKARTSLAAIWMYYITVGVPWPDFAMIALWWIGGRALLGHRRSTFLGATAVVATCGLVPCL